MYISNRPTTQNNNNNRTEGIKSKVKHRNGTGLLLYIHTYNRSFDSFGTNQIKRKLRNILVQHDNQNASERKVSVQTKMSLKKYVKSYTRDIFSLSHSPVYRTITWQRKTEYQQQHAIGDEKTARASPKWEKLRPINGVTNRYLKLLQ